MRRDTVTLVQQAGMVDHFAGLPEAIQARAGRVERADEISARTGLLVVADCLGVRARAVLAEARSAGVPSILLMDGLLHFRNTFHNPRVPATFLRPAPVEVVACAGELDRARLAWMGNRAVATGLPRLSGLRPLGAATEARVMVATARNPAFSREEWGSLVDLLRSLHDRLREMRVPALWRLGVGLDEEVGVESDTRPLLDCLRACNAVITTPSTLAIESMLAGRPTALLRGDVGPCWAQAAWNLGPDIDAAELASLLQRSRERAAAQRHLLGLQHRGDRSAAESLAELCEGCIGMPVRPDVAVPSAARVPAPRPAPSDRPVIVSLVACDGSPVGGVTTWSQRLGRAMPDLGFDFRTLLVVRNPDDWTGEDERAWVDDRTEVCVLDPLDSPPAQLRTLRAAVEAMGPSVVLPNYLDACYAVAMQLRARGVRTLAIAHTDSEYYRHLIETYSDFDGCVAVSDTIAHWLRPMAGARPTDQIVYGVPVAPRPREASASGPLRLAYIGRMTEEQKRISDLLPLIDGLESRGVEYEFHVVGDGDGMDNWKRKLAGRDLPPGRVTVHGKRPSRWVERFLPSVDVSVLVSEYEGTSITMLEAMGQGVVPAVTRVASGVDQWVVDGVTGVTAPVGEPDRLAARIAWLAEDRSRLDTLGRAAWERARTQSIERMAERYAAIISEVLRRRPAHRPTDLGLRLIEPHWTEHPVPITPADLGWVTGVLRESGFGSPGPLPADAARAVTILDHTTPDETLAAIRAERRPVVRLPYLVDRLPANALRRALEPVLAEGCRRVAVYGAGRHTRRARDLFNLGLPIVGIIDDGAREGATLFGLPVVPLGEAESRLAPDAILLSSDAFEKEMAERCRPLEDRGVRVIRIYTDAPVAGAA